MALVLFEFVEQFLMYTFLLKLNQFEKTGSIGTTFIPLGDLIITFLSKLEIDQVFRDLSTFPVR